jgi:hypothetical protein
VTSSAPEHWRRRCARVLGVLVLVGAVLSSTWVHPTTVSAAPGPIVSRDAATMTTDALPTAQVNGVVWSQAMAGNTVFAGGAFTSVRPAGAAPGTGQVKRSNLMSYDITTGRATAFAPTFNGPVEVVLVSPDRSTLFVAGQFTVVNKVKRNRVAAFSVATGALTKLAPDVNNQVNALAVIGNTLYLGGAFSAVNRVARSRLAAVNTSTAALTRWAPTADAGVQALVATPDRTAVIAGGSFTRLNRTEALGMGSLSALTGAVRPWKINQVIKNHGDTSGILTLRADADTIYGGGYTYGRGTFEGVFAADPGTGAVKWLQDCHGDTYDVAPIGQQVYSVGHAHFCSNIGGFPDTKPRSAYYRALAVTKHPAGTVATNTQKGVGYGNFAGQPAPSLYNWFPDLTMGTYTTLKQAAWSVVGNSSYLALGGEFTAVNGTRQQGLVRMTLPTRAPRKQGPRDNGLTPVVAPSGAALRVSWPANWDRDDQSLSYSVLRNNVVVKTFRARSQFWRRPTLSYRDLTGQPGVSYAYRIRSTDPDGNTLAGPPVTARYPIDSSYAQLVRSDRASHQWRLGSAAGQRTAPDTAGRLTMTTAPGVRFGAAGAFAGDVDSAATYDGSVNATGTTASTTISGAPVSIEAWFRSTSRTGGALVSAGAGNRAGASRPGDRQLYLTATGRLTFAVDPKGTAAPVATTSSAAYNDGTWHQVVAVQAADGLQLFVDGALVARRAGSVAVPSVTGSWVTGGATWPNLPAAPVSHLLGALDDVAVFPAALRPRQVYDHFATGQPRYKRFELRRAQR